MSFSVFELMTISFLLLAVSCHGYAIANTAIQADEALFASDGIAIPAMIKGVSLVMFSLFALIWLWNEHHFHWF